MFMPKRIFTMLKFLKISNCHLAAYCILNYPSHIQNNIPFQSYSYY